MAQGYICTETRFVFYNGELIYTVEYTHALQTWFVFKNNKTTGAVFSTRKNALEPTKENAETVLQSYLKNN